MSNYDKNNVDSPTIADCNSPGVKEGTLNENSKNTPNTEGLTAATEGHLSTIFPNRAGSWNAQMALYNGKNPCVFLRGSDTEWAKWLALATKSDLASTDITPTPISGLVFFPATMFKKAGVAYLNLEITNTTSSAISMENGKVIATGLPIPYKKQQVYVEAIPWNNGDIGSNASTTPLRLCIDNTGRLCSYYPSANEKITPGMPICINMAYPIAE